jgi:hypothetical protein
MALPPRDPRLHTTSVENLLRHHVRRGSFATESSQTQDQPCPLCIPKATDTSLRELAFIADGYAGFHLQRQRATRFVR